jgi:hypothetical protein
MSDRHDVNRGVRNHNFAHKWRYKRGKHHPKFRYRYRGQNEVDRDVSRKTYWKNQRWRNEQAEIISRKAKRINDMYKKRYEYRLSQALQAQRDEMDRNFLSSEKSEQSIQNDEESKCSQLSVPSCCREGYERSLGIRNSSTDLQQLPNSCTEDVDPSSGAVLVNKDEITNKALNVYQVEMKDWTKVVLQHPSACNMSMADTYNIVWDSGASMCITNDETDFIGPVEEIQNAKVDGINSFMKLEGVGTVCWSMLDLSGNMRHIKLPAYYAPNARQRLLSTSVFCKIYPNNNIVLNPQSWTVQPDPNNLCESAIDIMINPLNNLPMTTCMRPESLGQLAVNFAEQISCIHSNNFNLSCPQKELLRWHYRLGHMSMKTIQQLLGMGVMAMSQSYERLHNRVRKLRHEDLPKCAACQFGKQTSRRVPGRKSRMIKEKWEFSLQKLCILENECLWIILFVRLEEEKSKVKEFETEDAKRQYQKRRNHTVEDVSL